LAALAFVSATALHKFEEFRTPRNRENQFPVAIAAKEKIYHFRKKMKKPKECSILRETCFFPSPLLLRHKSVRSSRPEPDMNATTTRMMKKKKSTQKMNDEKKKKESSKRDNGFRSIIIL
jgi:hypothetical protein